MTDRQRLASPLQNAPRARTATGPTRRNGTISSASSAPPRSSATTSRRAPSSSSKASISNRSWEDKESGAKKYRTEILVNELTLLGKPGGGSGEGGGSYAKSNTAPYTATAAAPAAAPDFADQGITDDDIPF